MASWFETREDALLTMRELDYKRLGPHPEEHRESDASRRMKPLPWPDSFPYLGPFTTQVPVGHFGGEETTLDPPLFAGTTGEFCFAAPPTATGFFGPPTAVCAEAGDKLVASAPSTITIAAVAPILMDAFPSCRALNRLTQFA
jgi:hypothetical protein